MMICDIEANGLLDSATKIWCMNVYDTVLECWLEFKSHRVDEIPEFLNSVGGDFCFHNGVCYDIPLVEKLYPKWKFKGRLFDTLFASRILWPDRMHPCGGKSPHGIDSWGETFGIKKPKHEDWSKFSEEMLHRNKEDVRIGAKLYDYICKYLHEISEKDDRISYNKFLEILDFEQEVAGVIEKQASNGWLFNLQKAYGFIDDLDIKINEIKSVLTTSLPKVVKIPSVNTIKAFKANGDPTENTKKWFKDTSSLCGDYCKVIFNDINLNSSSQVKNYLLNNGWEPENWNTKKDRFKKNERDSKGGLIKTSPKSPSTVEEWERVAEKINNPEIKLLSEYNKASHRQSQIKGLISCLRDDFRIEAQANSCGANTSRMLHRQIVNIPKASDKVYYGKEMRSLFICPENKVLVGIDACALEARVEAHYIYDFDRNSAYELIEGDVHTLNAGVFQCSRDLAKNGKYALTYGCSASKLATTLNKLINQSKELYESFWDANPGLKKLKELAESQYDIYGYVLAIDKRILTIRYKHAIINTLFQSAGSILMKQALLLFTKWLSLKFNENEYKLVGNFHDEIQTECDPEIAEEVGKLGVESIQRAGEIFNMKVPFTGEYKIGKDWSLTH